MIKKRIGLYFGSFNPIHEGHIFVVQKALENGIKLIYYKQNKLPNWITNKEDYFSRSKLLIEYIKHYENF